jgi:hypothetical protein
MGNRSDDFSFLRQALPIYGRGFLWMVIATVVALFLLIAGLSVFKYPTIWLWAAFGLSLLCLLLAAWAFISRNLKERWFEAVTIIALVLIAITSSITTVPHDLSAVHDQVDKHLTWPNAGVILSNTMAAVLLAVKYVSTLRQQNKQ